MRTLAEAIDTDARRPDVSSYALATSCRGLAELYYRATAGDTHVDDFADLVAVLSAPPVDPPPA